jgi:hypothetical protein
LKIVLFLHKKLMKRTLLLIAVVAAISFLSTSCLKSWVCSCKSAINPTANHNYTDEELSGKTQAKANCENYQTTGRTVSAPDYTCELE